MKNGGDIHENALHLWIARGVPFEGIHVVSAVPVNVVCTIGNQTIDKDQGITYINGGLLRRWPIWDSG